MAFESKKHRICKTLHRGPLLSTCLNLDKVLLTRSIGAVSKNSRSLIKVLDCEKRVKMHRCILLKSWLTYKGTLTTEVANKDNVQYYCQEVDAARSWDMCYLRKQEVKRPGIELVTRH